MPTSFLFDCRKRVSSHLVKTADGIINVTVRSIHHRRGFLPLKGNHASERSWKLKGERRRSGEGRVSQRRTRSLSRRRSLFLVFLVFLLRLYRLLARLYLSLPLLVDVCVGIFALIRGTLSAKSSSGLDMGLDNLPRSLCQAPKRFARQGKGDRQRSRRFSNA